MLEIRFNMADFERKAREVGGALDQVPFAISLALNDAAERTRTRLITQTWPSHVRVRKAGFMNAALTTRGQRATKRNLKVVIYDQLHRASLPLHAQGGVKLAKGRLAIPTANVRIGSSGVVASQRPGALSRKVVKGNLIFQRQGKGRAQKLRLMFKLAKSARIRKDVPFIDDFRSTMLAEIRQTFPKAMARAMLTRK